VGYSAYLLKHVIHDWDDARAVAILRSCRRAMEPDARLLLIEGLYPPRISKSEESLSAAANDVNMLVCTGGRQRSKHEFEELFATVGLKLTRIVSTGLPVVVVEGAPS
jgi:orsellinic acid C2-O-methyltransferase